MFLHTFPIFCFGVKWYPLDEDFSINYHADVLIYSLFQQILSYLLLSYYVNKTDSILNFLIVLLFYLKLSDSATIFLHVHQSYPTRQVLHL